MYISQNSSTMYAYNKGVLQSVLLRVFYSIRAPPISLVTGICKDSWLVRVEIEHPFVGLYARADSVHGPGAMVHPNKLHEKGTDR